MPDLPRPVRPAVPALLLVRRPSTAIRGGVLLGALVLALGLALPRAPEAVAAVPDLPAAARIADLPCTRLADIAAAPGGHCLKDGRSVRVVLR